MTTIDTHTSHVGPVVPLDHPLARQPAAAGSKAAHLARAARAGLPVLPGFVILHGPGAEAHEPPAHDGLTTRQAWRELSADGARPLVVRSSSPQEDTHESSMAGQFASVLAVRGWDAFHAAVRTVLDSARRTRSGPAAPMAVLVQPMLAVRAGGVLFTADPLTARLDRMLVSAVPGGPDALVGGARSGTDYHLTRRGRLLRTEPPDGPDSPDGPAAARPLTRTELHRLARLGHRAEQAIGGPQDIEFGFDEDGGLWLFQSRPVTALAARPAPGARLLGPGPVAETLPEALQPLEEDLWVVPMARGLTAALDIGAAAPRRRLRAAPVVTTVGGRAVADLELLGAAPTRPRRRLRSVLNPLPGARRLSAAWRVGRLRATLPHLALDLLADVDRRLAETPPPHELDRAELTDLLRWARAALVALHAQEALAGALLPTDRPGTAASEALAALTDGRARGLSDPGIVATAPVVLALVPPSLVRPLRLPAPTPLGGAEADSGGGAPPPRDTTDAPPGPAVPPARGATPALGSGPRLAAEAAPYEPALGPPPAPAPHRTDTAPHNAPPRAALSAAPAVPAQGVAAAAAAQPAPARGVAALPVREGLRLRIRWVHELQVRLVREAAVRMAARGALAEPGRVALLRWPEFMAAAVCGPLPVDLAERLPRPPAGPLPDAFRLAADGTVVPERAVGPRARRGADGAGLGVSGGRASGTAWDGNGPRPPDAVLVVRTLDPALAPLLPPLTGLVAQTGSPLSHLAVLAREFGLPTVVGAADAVRRFPPGTRLVLDGTTGEVCAEVAP
ncbi:MULTISPECIES: PEP/pyruvate-binding domain-containing protein [unclassified Streptomyces]|uniref:PEP/pyruvate-binding domain-containing protein n=1 Tax=unclassified Streptomyces TaxID=2593676 RepID=UPI003369BDBA